MSNAKLTKAVRVNVIRSLVQPSTYFAKTRTGEATHMLVPLDEYRRLKRAEVELRKIYLDKNTTPEVIGHAFDALKPLKKRKVKNG